MADGGATITQISDLPSDEQQLLAAYRTLPVVQRDALLRSMRNMREVLPVAPVATTQERAEALAALAKVRARRVSDLKLADQPLRSR